MCIGIEYFLEGERHAVYYDSPAPDLPVRLRGGAIGFYRWGARSTAFYELGNIAGWGAKFPETGYAALDDIRAGKWSNFEPRPVRIFAARFIQVNSWEVPCYFALKPGEFIQGLVATITHHRRLYVVTVPAPVEYADEQWYWPRIVAVPES
jgi:hypothetical protein